MVAAATAAAIKAAQPSVLTSRPSAPVARKVLLRAQPLRLAPIKASRHVVTIHSRLARSKIHVTTHDTIHVSRHVKKTVTSLVKTSRSHRAHKAIQMHKAQARLIALPRMVMRPLVLTKVPAAAQAARPKAQAASSQRVRVQGASAVKFTWSSAVN